MTLNPEVTGEIDKSRKVQATIEIAQKHPFEFGFRYPIQTGVASIVKNENGHWQILYPPPKISAAVWYGNCVDDANVTAVFLRGELRDEAGVTLQHVYAKKLGNATYATDHYRVRVERPSESNSVFEEIDHSPFHDRYIGPTNLTIVDWVDVAPEEEKALYPEGVSAIARGLNTLAYSEFDSAGGRGISLLTITDNPGGASFSITFDLIMPELAEDQAKKAISFNVFFDQLGDKKKLLKILGSQPFFTKPSEPDKEIDIPLDLKLKARNWFEEVIRAIKPQNTRGASLWDRLRSRLHTKEP